MSTEAMIAAILEAGATKAVEISGSQVVLSAEFRKICESNQCGGYDRCWMCPPHLGPIEELMAEVRRYPRAILYQTISEIEDSYDIEGMFAASAGHAQVSQRIQTALKPQIEGKMLHLTCGGCHLCETCAKREGQPCRMPDKALPSLEGYGVDVYNTTKDTPLKYINGENTVTYFGMILFGV